MLTKICLNESINISINYSPILKPISHFFPIHPIIIIIICMNVFFFLQRPLLHVGHQSPRVNDRFPCHWRFRQPTNPYFYLLKTFIYYHNMLIWLSKYCTLGATSFPFNLFFYRSWSSLLTTNLKLWKPDVKTVSSFCGKVIYFYFAMLFLYYRPYSK